MNTSEQKIQRGPVFLFLLHTVSDALTGKNAFCVAATRSTYGMRSEVVPTCLLYGMLLYEKLFC